MKYRSVFLTLATALATLSAGAAIPAGYYDACKGKSKGALKSQLYTIVKNHNAISYGDATWRAFKSTDVRDGKYWWDIYTDANVNISGNSSMNIEHSFPKSWWGGSKNDAYKDIVHLMPVNANANNLRNNYPFAEVETEKSYKQQVPSPRFRYGYPKSGQGGNATYVFEPDDEYKGDLARTYFYMVTCYQNLTWSGNGTYTAAQNTYPTLQPWAQEMLLRWHREDPVSQKELDRNEGVYREQGNRNPFIDHPEMVEHIWGDRQNQGWATGAVDPDPDPDPDPVYAELTAPLNGDYYKFEDVRPGQTMSLEIPVLGKGLTRSVVAKISGAAADRFSIVVGKSELKALTVSASDVNNKEGYGMTIRYTPAGVTQGIDEAVLTFTGAELEEPVSVHLQGTCVAPVTLPAPVALPAEQVSAEGYTARWMKIAREVDGYIVYRSIYNADATAVEQKLTYEVEADAESLAIDDRDETRRESYAVSAILGDVESPLSNEIIVSEAAGISDIESDSRAARWFTPEGYELDTAPAAPGVYIMAVGSKQVKTIIVR